MMFFWVLASCWQNTEERHHLHRLENLRSHIVSLYGQAILRRGLHGAKPQKNIVIKLNHVLTCVALRNLQRSKNLKERTDGCIKLNVTGMDTIFSKGLDPVRWYAYDIKIVRREISGSHAGENEDDCLLGCFAVQSVEIVQFQRFLLPPSSGRFALSSKHLWNVGKFLGDYTVEHPRRQSSSNRLTLFMFTKLIRKPAIEF
jgi:hypothetical protein